MKHALLALLFAATTACAQIKISELPAASTLTGTEATMVTQGGVSKKATVTQINAYTLTASGTLTGKTISGSANTLSNVAFSALTGLPTTLAGYGITDGLLAATAASTYATITNLNLKAPIDSPTFTGTVTGPTFVGALTGNASTVTTNANLTGPVTSVGNATAIANGAISNAMLSNGAVANLSGTNTGDQSLAAYLLSATAASTYATIASLGGAASLDASADATADAVARYDESGRLRATSFNFKDSGFEAALIAESLTGNVEYKLPSQAEDGLRLLTTGGSGANLTALNATQLTSGTVPAARMPALTGDITTTAGAVATTIATGVVGPTQLASTAVTAGSYTATNLTVDADGRITAASNGSGGGITIGTTTSNGTAGRVLYTDGTNVQAYSITGTGNVMMSANPISTGTATFGTVATNSITGVTQPTTTMAVGGNSNFPYGTEFGSFSGHVLTIGKNLGASSSSGILMRSDYGFYFSSGTNTSVSAVDVGIERSAAGVLKIVAGPGGALRDLSARAVTLGTAGLLSITSGTNQRAGDATLASGTVTVSNTTVTANTRVFITRKTAGGTLGMALTYTVSAATSFTINSDNVLDTSVVSYFLVEVP